MSMTKASNIVRMAPMRGKGTMDIKDNTDNAVNKMTVCVPYLFKSPATSIITQHIAPVAEVATANRR